MPSRIDRFREIAKKTRKETNAKLAREISALMPLTENEIARLLPTKADKENLMRLMEIVSDATTENQKLAALTANINKLGSVAIRVIKAVVLR